MEIEHLMNYFILTGQKLDVLWQFFVTIHLAILGGVLFFRRLHKSEIAILLLSYLIFSLVNIRAKINEYEIYTHLIKDIKKNIPSTYDLASFFNSYSVDDRYCITLVIHIASFIALCYMIWLRRKYGEISPDAM